MMALPAGCDGENPTSTGGAGGSDTGGAPSGGAGGSGANGGSGGSRGPAYDAGTAGCPAGDGVRRIKLVNNCAEPRWFKLDGRTTPLWARPQDCPWAGASCDDPEGVAGCTPIAAAMSGGDPGITYCKAGPGGNTCACNPFFELGPGEEHEIEMPADAAFPSGTGWLAVGCNKWGHTCTTGNDAAKSSTFEFTYDNPGQGSLYYDISAVNAWTTASAVGMKSCGGAEPDPADVFWCRGTGCRFDVATQCPDGTDTFPAAPAGCMECPTMIVEGKQVLAGSCGTCPDGADANRIPTGTVFNPNNVGGPEWTWTGPPDFALGLGHDEGARADRSFSCGPGGCDPAPAGEANTCLGGCDL